MRQRANIVLGVLLAAFLGTGMAACTRAVPKSFVWQRLDVDVLVMEDGRLDITETITLRYASGSLTWMVRDLPSRHLDLITDIRVRDAEQAYREVSDKQSKVPYTYAVFPNEGTERVRLVYPETTTGERTLVLNYKVEGAIARYADHDEVSWPIVFPAREELVTEASGQIRLPAGVPAADIRASLPDMPGSLTIEDGVLSVTAQAIPPGQTLTLVVQFPTGLAAGMAPRWQMAAEAQARYDATMRPTVDRTLAAGAAALLLALAGSLGSYLKRRRDPAPVSWTTLAAIGQMPDELEPALVACLVERQAGALNATLLDLARRGYVRFTELLQGRCSWSRDVLAERTVRSPDDLQSFEARALDLLFEGQMQVLVKDRRTRLTNALPRYNKGLQDTLTGRGLLSQNGLKSRQTALFLGGLFLTVGFVGLIVAGVFAKRVSGWLPAVPGVLLASGTTWLIGGLSIRGTTEAGAAAYAAWRTFGTFLRRLKPSQVPLRQFERLLPYAAALVNTRPFVKAYGESDEPLPVWFQPASGLPAARQTLAALGQVALLRDHSAGFTASMTTIASSSGHSAAGGGGGGVGGGAGGGAAG